jgi:alanine racemase
MIQQDSHAGAILTIDLGAIRSNYRSLRERAGQAQCAAVVKADAYGLGAARVAAALATEGCRHFFVAHLNEGIALRPHLPANVEIFVLHGPPVGSDAEFVRHRLIPVLNSTAQIAGWRQLAQRENRALPAIVQVDSGMSRLGLSPAEVEAGVADPDFLRGIALRYLMSHLACAEATDHPMNALQLANFTAARRRFPACGASFANSSGIFLGPDYHFDLLRPGAALYGIAPVAGAANPMQAVVRLQGKIIQTRSIAAGDHVGYGLRYCAPGTRVIATVSVGYADGWLRSASGRGSAVIGGHQVAQVGTVSMDTITLDVTGVDPARLLPGMPVDLISPSRTVDAVAEAAGTIGYEILTSLGARYRREYLDAAIVPTVAFDTDAAVAASMQDNTLTI